VPAAWGTEVLLMVLLLHLLVVFHQMVLHPVLVLLEAIQMVLLVGFFILCLMVGQLDLAQ
jgi:hypothetical protein